MRFVEKPGKYYYHYPFPVAIVGVLYNQRVNFMSAAWHTQISFDPPLYGVAISPKRFTNNLIEKAGTFSVSFLKYDDYKFSGFFGRTSGKDLEKDKFFGIKYTVGKKIEVPVIDFAVSCYECKVIDSKVYGDHILYVGEILALHYNEEFYHDGISDKLLMYAGNDMYVTTDKNSLVKFGKEEVDEIVRTKIKQK
uniref:Flavin reductase n=1 Tax=Fervidobacterium nodosum TaxID=2424 RepID=A0A7C5U5D9_9BACT